jgi:hypothetical protein
MKGFVGNIERLTQDNEDFRRVLNTGHKLQLVLMALRPAEEIGEEVHDDRDQFSELKPERARSGSTASVTTPRLTTASSCRRERVTM